MSKHGLREVVKSLCWRD